MGKIVFFIVVLLLSHSQITVCEDAATPLQQQLQRLQSAVQQTRQTGSNIASQPAFLNTPPQQQGSVPPPIGGVQVPAAPPGAGGVTTTTTTIAPPAAQVGIGATAQAPDGGNQAPPMIQGFNMRDQAFTDTTDSLLPLTADQIRTLHTLFSQTQRAVGEIPGIPPRPTSTSKIVNLSPGATPPIIRLAAGFVTSLVFLDASGTAWPVEAYDLGDPRSFNIQWDKKGNTLLVQAITEYKTGNLAVLLRGLNTPVMITLLPGQRAVDYRVDLRIPGIGPNTVPNVTTTLNTLPGASNPILLDVLNGIPPAGARPLQIVGRDCQVWLVGGRMYLRTRATVLSPAWFATLSSADGMHAYEMPPTPIILASEDGKMVKMSIQGL